MRLFFVQRTNHPVPAVVAEMHPSCCKHNISRANFLLSAPVNVQPSATANPLIKCALAPPPALTQSRNRWSTQPTNWPT